MSAQDLHRDIRAYRMAHQDDLRSARPCFEPPNEGVQFSLDEADLLFEAAGLRRAAIVMTIAGRGFFHFETVQAVAVDVEFIRDALLGGQRRQSVCERCEKGVVVADEAWVAADHVDDYRGVVCTCILSRWENCLLEAIG